ncbi:MAG: glycine cleavage system protein H [Asgard group archaeon]|nr:glycine cleavage system protein H [Asgard group archaeon]
MSQKVSVLPCGGTNKQYGMIANELALQLKELNPTIKIICFPLLASDENSYSEIIKESRVIVLDGCASRCASKVLQKKEYSKVKKVYFLDELKKHNIKLGDSKRISEEGWKFIEILKKQIIQELKEESEKSEAPIVEKEFGEIAYFEVTYDKYHFRVPKEGYYFSENDCWVKPEGKTALLGITDYLQNQSSDVLFVDLPEVGTEIEQFDEAVNYESVKALLSLIAPVSGKIIAANRKLEEESDLLNSDPYEQGWMIEIELNEFEEEKDLLMNGKDYFKYMKKKIEEEL